MADNKPTPAGKPVVASAPAVKPAAAAVKPSTTKRPAAAAAAPVPGAVSAAKVSAKARTPKENVVTDSASFLATIPGRSVILPELKEIAVGSLRNSLALGGWLGKPGSTDAYTVPATEAYAGIKEADAISDDDRVNLFKTTSKNKSLFSDKYFSLAQKKSDKDKKAYTFQLQSQAGLAFVALADTKIVRHGKIDKKTPALAEGIADKGYEIVDVKKGEKFTLTQAEVISTFFGNPGFYGENIKGDIDAGLDAFEIELSGEKVQVVLSLNASKPAQSAASGAGDKANTRFVTDGLQLTATLFNAADKKKNYLKFAELIPAVVDGENGPALSEWLKADQAQGSVSNAERWAAFLKTERKASQPREAGEGAKGRKPAVEKVKAPKVPSFLL